jgi:hypothetical protein
VKLKGFSWCNYLLICVGFLALLGVITMSRVYADGPGPDFKLYSGPNATFPSPDQKVIVEQYFKALGDQGDLHQFWTFDQKHQHPFLLNPGEGLDLAGYPAGFRFSADSHWLVRMQKTGAGYSSLFLYHRADNHFLPATKKPLSDLAWDYFFSLPASQGMHRNDPDSFNHVTAELVQGMDDNYKSLGEHWPDSRFIVISLSFDAYGGKVPPPSVHAWRCVYDLKTGEFSVPSDFIQHNADAAKMKM